MKLIYSYFIETFLHNFFSKLDNLSDLEIDPFDISYLPGIDEVERTRDTDASKPLVPRLGLTHII